MKLRINRQHLFNALIFAMVLSAAIHLFVCFFKAIVTGNPDYANMFNILGLSFIWPELGTGALNSLIGIVLVIGIGVIAYFYLESKRRP